MDPERGRGKKRKSEDGEKKRDVELLVRQCGWRGEHQQQCCIKKEMKRREREP